MRIKTLLTLLLSALAAAASFAASPNLVSGGTFDDPAAVNVWTKPSLSSKFENNNMTLAWFGVDALGSPDSGSMILSGLGRRLQCVPVTAGQSYDFGARLLLAVRGHSPTPVAYLRTTFYADEQCSTPALTQTLSDPTTVSGRFIAVAGTVQAAPGASSAALEINMPSIAGYILDGGAPIAYVDDVFFRESAGCTPNTETLCFARGTLRATMRVIDSSGSALAARSVQTSPTTGYFSFATADLPDVTIKTYDFADSGGGRWFVVGGLTKQRVEIKVEDVAHHEVRTYANVAGQYLEPVVDAFFNP